MRPVSVSRFLVTKGTEKSGCKVAKNENWDLSVVLDKDKRSSPNHFLLYPPFYYPVQLQQTLLQWTNGEKSFDCNWTLEERERARSSKQFVFCWQHQLHCALCFLVVVRNAFNSTEQNLWVDEKAPTHLSWGSRKKGSSHRSIYFELSKPGKSRRWLSCHKRLCSFLPKYDDDVTATRCQFLMGH